MTIHSFKTLAAQGDVILRRVAALPDGLTAQKRTGPIVVAHSETGHHHAISEENVVLYDVPGDPLIAYLQVGGEYAHLVHHRAHHTHETLRLTPGIYQVVRQRESKANANVGPWAGRRAAD